MRSRRLRTSGAQVLALTVLLAAPAAARQAPEIGARPSGAQDGALAESHAAVAELDPLVASLRARSKAARDALRRRRAAATSDEELVQIARESPLPALLEEHERFALEHADHDAAVDAWAGAIGLAAECERYATWSRALAALEDRHLASPRLAASLAAFGDGARWFGTNRWEVSLRRAAQGSPHAAVKAFALYLLADSLGRAEHALPNRDPQAGATDTSAVRFEPTMLAERKREAVRLLALVEQRFADALPTAAPSPDLPKDWLARRVEALRFELEHLQVGMLAPDFETVDEHGNPWKLSDYRGRVVLLDFWGLWCVPCRAMLPDAKALVQRLANERFSLLGVNSDGDHATLRERLEREGVVWRQALDGDTNGPIATRWNVQSWPTLVLLDADGVIRSRELPRDEARMEALIRALLAELPRAASR
ncbi:MAG: TlpA family protein disulfide reductase [Planctomycetes bacterium]|nr:TlpA family protein disulfide reductase [Planctomycetota bacterium]